MGQRKMIAMATMNHTNLTTCNVLAQGQAALVPVSGLALIDELLVIDEPDGIGRHEPS
jgi:hypothetical protein